MSNDLINAYTGENVPPILGYISSTESSNPGILCHPERKSQIHHLHNPNSIPILPIFHRS